MVIGHHSGVHWLEDVWRRFRRELPNLVVPFAVVWIVFMVLGFVLVRDFDPFVMGIALALLFVAVLPMMWLRYGDQPIVRPAHHRVRRTFALIGLGFLWTAVALVVIGGVLAWLGIE